MDSSEQNQQHFLPNPPPPPTTHPTKSNLKKFAFFTAPLLVLFTAISLGFTTTNYYKLHYLRHTLSSSQSQNLFQAIGSLISPRKPNLVVPSHCVLWMAPFLSGGGYSSEAWSYVLSLHKHSKMHPFRIAIEHHGDLESLDFWEGLPQNMKDLAYELHQTKCRMNETIVVCHSEPGAWYPPLFQTFPCPPSPSYSDFKSVIGRTMFETDRVNGEHVERCNRMDHVWVPTDFHRSTFVGSGVDPSKVVKIVQPIDVEFFDPAKYKPLDLASKAELVLGTTILKESFVFLSIFKWEYRKGWDVLLRSYLKEFRKDDGVSLFLLTNPYHTESDFGNKIVDFVESSSDLVELVSDFAPVYVINTHIAQNELPRVYSSADGFVLASRGEGWGRPLVEAMSMAMPVIATNWSGPTEFLTDDNSYPVPVDRMTEVVEGPFKGHLWAEPSEHELRVIMRKVVEDRSEALAKGRKAREDMVRRFAPEVVAEIVTNHIQNLLRQ